MVSYYDVTAGYEERLKGQDQYTIVKRRTESSSFFHLYTHWLKNRDTPLSAERSVSRWIDFPPRTVVFRELGQAFACARLYPRRLNVESSAANSSISSLVRIKIWYSNAINRFASYLLNEYQLPLLRKTGIMCYFLFPVHLPLTYSLTYSMVHDIIWKADCHLACQKYPTFLWNPKVLDPYLPKVHLNVILPPTPVSSQWSLTLRPPNRNPVNTFLLLRVCYMYRLPHPPWFNHPNNIRWRIQAVKLGWAYQISRMSPVE